VGVGGQPQKPYAAFAASNDGRRSNSFVSASNAAPMPSTVGSSKARPTICIESGRPLAEKPVGVDIAGLPVTSNGMVCTGKFGGTFGSMSAKAGAGVIVQPAIKAS